jgi:hypothetical protein
MVYSGNENTISFHIDFFFLSPLSCYIECRKNVNATQRDEEEFSGRVMNGFNLCKRYANCD